MRRDHAGRLWPTRLGEHVLFWCLVIPALAGVVWLAFQARDLTGSLLRSFL